MNIDDDIMTDEEFFGELDAGGTMTPRTPHRCGESAEKDIFREVKLKMVMRIYGVSRSKAMKIIAAREKAKNAAEEAKAGLKKDRRRISRGNDMISTEDFFGA